MRGHVLVLSASFNVVFLSQWFSNYYAFRLGYCIVIFLCPIHWEWLKCVLLSIGLIMAEVFCWEESKSFFIIFFFQRSFRLLDELNRNYLTYRIYSASARSQPGACTSHLPLLQSLWELKKCKDSSFMPGFQTGNLSCYPTQRESCISICGSLYKDLTAYELI